MVCVFLQDLKSNVLVCIGALNVYVPVGQIGFESGEQLSLDVAGDSAKTLSFLGNLEGAVDDYDLRHVQRWRRNPHLNFGGPTDFIEISLQKDVRLHSALYAPPLLSPLGYTPKTPVHQKNAL